MSSPDAPTVDLDPAPDRAAADRKAGPFSPSASRIIRRQRILVALSLLAVILSIGGLIVSFQIKSPAQDAAERSAPSASVISAQVERRVLAQTIITRGSVGSAAQFAVTPAASTQGASALVVTAVHTSVGAELSPGSVPIEVSGRPIIVLPGTLPSYRDLKPGDDGTDIAQLQSALATLGYYTNQDPAGHFGPATKQAVTKLYQHLGFDVATTGGPKDAGDATALKSAQAAVDSARRAVDDLQLQINAQTQPAAAGQEPLPLQMQYLRKALAAAQQEQATLVADTGPMLPVGEAVFLPSFPARVSAFSSAVGQTVQAPLLTVSSGPLVVTSQMTPDQGGSVRVGMKVQITSESQGASVNGTVSAVGTLTTPQASTDSTTSNAGGSDVAYIPVTVTPDQAMPASWYAQDVRITITAASTNGPVLVVPLSAVSTGANGLATVSKLGQDHKNSAPVLVTAGLSGDGYLEVKPTQPDSLKEGDYVAIAGAATASSSP